MYNTYVFILLTNIIIMVTSIIFLSTNESVNKLISFVIIVFFQGLILLSLGSNILSLFLIIIYVGAIAILFCFMIYFINMQKEKYFKDTRWKLIFTFTYITLYTLIIIREKLRFKEVLISEKLKGELNTMESIGQIYYSNLTTPLFIMVLILMLGLILVIKITLNKKIDN